MRFVTPESVRIELKDGPDGEKRWIRVKKALTAGEDQALRTAGMKRVSAESNAIEIDWREMAFARAATYMVDWSATEQDPKKKDHQRAVKISPERLQMLHPEDFEEIDNAIKEHLKAEADTAKGTPDNND